MQLKFSRWLRAYAFCRFVWDEAKYPTMSPLREIVDGIHVQIAKIEDDLKVCSVSLVDVGTINVEVMS